MRSNKTDVKRLVEEMTHIVNEFKANNRRFPAHIEAFVKKEEEYLIDLGLNNLVNDVLTLYYNGKDDELIKAINSIIDMLESLHKVYLQHDAIVDYLLNTISSNNLESTYHIKETFGRNDANDEDW